MSEPLPSAEALLQRTLLYLDLTVIDAKRTLKEYHEENKHRHRDHSILVREQKDPELLAQQIRTYLSVKK